MNVLSGEQVNDIIKKRILEGAVFIYPTDTIYGIGCNALDAESVERIRKLKNRPTQPFSVIAPSKRWIKDNCSIKSGWLEKLPGPYTFLVRLKKKCVSANVNEYSELLGVRVPDHWISGLVQELEVPIITTSVNKSGESYMKSLEDLDPDIKQEVDFVIYEGKIEGHPSKVYDLSKDKAEVVR